MSEVKTVISSNKKEFISRIEEIQDYLERLYETFFENHRIKKFERIDSSERIRIAGFHPELSSWKHYSRDITVSSCEVVNGEQKRFDYTFTFVEEKREKPSEELVEDDTPVETKGFREFTEKEKEEYRIKKEKEKEVVEQRFQDFLEKQTIKDIVEIIETTKQTPEFKLEELESMEVAETEESDKELIEISEYAQVHGYSIRNFLLVLSQAKNRGDDKFVGIINSFWNWKKQGVSVLKNPDKSKPYSYKILVPVKKEGTLKGFKLGSVFDISQTNKYDEFLINQQEAMSELPQKEEIDYDEGIRFVRTNFPNLNLIEDFRENDLMGDYNPQDMTLTIHQKDSHTLFHELGKHIIYNELELQNYPSQDPLKEEILAEITSYLLTKRFEKVDEFKINYNFGYSNCWTHHILDEFKFGEFENTYSELSRYVNELKVAN
ncbi:MAG: hypothetical protein GF353_15915 [Candidatus Lokiarchaeota archaeon]|nr:hypothetical protein [Candidatus Lokiarchaeota archaeon]